MWLELLFCLTLAALIALKYIKIFTLGTKMMKHLIQVSRRMTVNSGIEPTRIGDTLKFTYTVRDKEKKTDLKYDLYMPYEHALPHQFCTFYGIKDTQATKLEIENGIPLYFTPHQLNFDSIEVRIGESVKRVVTTNEYVHVCSSKVEEVSFF